MYTQLIDHNTSNVLVIQDTESGYYVPLDKSNPRYRAYLSWVANGNSPQQQVINAPATPTQAPAK